jgi:hypothetical protein
MTLPIFFGAIVAYWLFTTAASVWAFVWSFNARRFWPCIVLSAMAFIGSIYGMSHFRISSSKTVNGQVQYSFDSKWFFIASLVISVLVAAFVLWNKWKASHAAPPVIAETTGPSK